LDFTARGIDRHDQCRKEFGAFLKQPQPVAGNRPDSPEKE
jgi:hypothetical protein